MKLLEDLKKSLAKVYDSRKQIGVLVLNEKDFDEIREYVNEDWFGPVLLSPNDQKLLGNKLIVIPRYLYDPRFLKIGQILILEQNYFEFLKGALNG